MDKRYNLIVVREYPDGRFIADFKNIPGMPIIGYGSTSSEAIGNLIISHKDDLGILIEMDKGE